MTRCEKGLLVYGRSKDIIIMDYHLHSIDHWASCLNRRTLSTCTKYDVLVLIIIYMYKFWQECVQYDRNHLFVEIRRPPSIRRSQRQLHVEWLGHRRGHVQPIWPYLYARRVWSMVRHWWACVVYPLKSSVCPRTRVPGTWKHESSQGG